MTSGIFSNISVPAVTMTAPNVQRVELQNQANTAVEKTKKQKYIDAAKKAAPVVLPLVAIPVTALITYKITNKNSKILKDSMESLKDTVTTLSKEVGNVKTDFSKYKSAAEETINAGKAADAKMWAAILGIAGMTGAYKAGKLADDKTAALKKEDKEEVDEVIKTVNNERNNWRNALSSVQHSSLTNGNNLGKKYLSNYYGIQLLKNETPINDKLADEIQKTSEQYLKKPPVAKPIDSDHPCLWSVTSEFQPIKEGGLGSVPVAIQNNFDKIGVKLPTFLPMYLDNGISAFTEKDGIYNYQYKNNKAYDLKKLASFQVDTFQAGKSKTEDVEVYMAENNGKPLIFIKNDNYFNGSIYSTGAKTEEPEKFAFFSKVVYELAKLRECIDDVQIGKVLYNEKGEVIKKNPNILKNLSLYDEAAFKSIPKMDALLLNDWQAAPIAALARYKAPVEAEFGNIPKEVANKLKNINIITIGHNAMYQGSTKNNNNDEQRREATSNILNTLFDKYTYDIVSNANCKASATDKSDAGLKNLDNVLLLNESDYSQNHVNLLNLGICLSDYFCPVSQNYANELISKDHADLSGELQWALTQKNKQKSLVGIINGNDFNILSIEATAEKTKELTGQELDTYNRENTIDEIMERRLKNKIKIYNNYIIPFSISKTSAKKDLKFIDTTQGMTLPKLTDEELKTTPIITSCGRLVSQKGINILTEAIDMLYKNWDKDFPGKNKPVFYLAGDDNANDKQSPHIIDLKNNKLSKEDSDRVIFAKGYAPMAALTSSSDFFIMSSIFEPCGLTQSEALALGTPVIASAVGGIVDTLNRDGKQNAILTDKNKKFDAVQLYEAMKKALKIYFDNPEQYKQMVRDSIDEDFSWIQPGKKGPCFDYLEKAGINKEKLSDVNQ